MLATPSIQAWSSSGVRRSIANIGRRLLLGRRLAVRGLLVVGAETEIAVRERADTFAGAVDVFVATVSTLTRHVRSPPRRDRPVDDLDDAQAARLGEREHVAREIGRELARAIAKQECDPRHVTPRRATNTPTNA